MTRKNVCKNDFVKPVAGFNSPLQIWMNCNMYIPLVISEHCTVLYKALVLTQANWRNTIKYWWLANCHYYLFFQQSILFHYSCMLRSLHDKWIIQTSSSISNEQWNKYWKWWKSLSSVSFPLWNESMRIKPPDIWNATFFN